MTGTWSDSLQLGIKQIDEQHRKFVGILDDLKGYMDRGESQAKMEEVLKRLEEYTLYHFQTEEDYFNKFKYENTAEHVNEHNKFKDDLRRYIQRAKTGDKTVMLEIYFYLVDWLKNHLKEQDHKYLECFKSHGL